MKDINDFLRMKIVWQEVKPNGSEYASQINGETVFLRLNDFPDEPIYTIIYKKKEFDIEESPKIWEFCREEK